MSREGATRNRGVYGARLWALVALASLVAVEAGASTIAQNSAWTVTRTGATDTLRIVAYGDSIFAGYTNATTVARRAAPYVAGEYCAALWGQNINVARRCQSGAVASGVYARINSTADRAFMADASTRVVTFEMCGNDYLQARSSFRSASGTCNYTGLTTAGNNCKSFTDQAMKNINQFASPNAKLKIVSNLYYPGYNADNAYSTCTDPVNGDPAHGNQVHMQTLFLPQLVESNWWTCKLAEDNGFECADAFAEYMAGDYDSNSDGLNDSDAIRYHKGELLADYKQRVLALKATLRDANFKMVDSTTSYDYIQSDDTHPTFVGVTASTFLTTPGGNNPVFFATAGAYPGGKNPQWNQNGHDRLGWGINPSCSSLTVDAGSDATITACNTFQSTGSFTDKILGGPWTVDVDYGDGSPIASQQVSVTTFALNHRYITANSYALKVTVTGKYGTVSTDSATMTVVSGVWDRVCYVDGDNDIDRNDIALVTAARNTPAQTCDPRDANVDGVIDVNDARACTLRCTRPGCAS